MELVKSSSFYSYNSGRETELPPSLYKLPGPKGPGFFLSSLSLGGLLINFDDAMILALCHQVDMNRDTPEQILL